MSDPKNESDLSIKRAAIIASLLHATLLAVVGGYLDAFTFVGKGRVFANSMTGNVVIMGSLLAIGQWRHASIRIPPILAFMVGSCCAKSMDLPPLRRIVRWPLMTSLTIEIVFLLVAGALPTSFPDSWLLMGISFVAALQNSTFARIEGQNLSTIMTTGNLKTLSESLVTLAFGPSDLDAVRRVRFFAAVCCSFLAGAVLGLGARLTPSIGNLALWPAALMLLIVWLHLGWALWSIVKRERR